MSDEKNEKHRTSKPFYASSSFWSLVIANLIVLAWAILEKLPLGFMFWVYFSQNVILGIFWSIKVFDSPFDSLYAKKVQSVAIFLPHYLLMHFLYGLSLYVFFGKDLLTNYKNILAMSGIFFLAETVSYFTERSPDRAKPLSLAQVQLFPYARVIPMHFIMCMGIPFGQANSNTRYIIMSFLLLKTLADIAMYFVGQNLVLGNTITDFFERYKENPLLSGYSNPNDEYEVCRFCEREIGIMEKHWYIKENIVCKKCYKKIGKEIMDND
ncbi:MAG: DUF6498-containing protein [Planctomycetota bacterium]|jgi:hypothetical protein